jgi:alpha-1,2-mannosyltransferase
VAISALLCTFLAIEGRHYGTDLRVYRESVSAWSKGVNPYLVSYTNGLHFTYTPFALVVLWPLRLASFQVTEWVLWLGTCAACAISTWLILRAESRQGGAGSSWWSAITWASAALLLLEPVRSGLTYGQVEAILMLAILVDALVIPTPYRGIVIGIVSAIKLTPLIFIVFLLVRDWRSAIRAGASFVAVTAWAWLLWPKESKSFWLHDVFKPGRVGGVSYAGNQSWFGVLHRAPFLHAGSVVLWLILCVMTLLIGTLVTWRNVVFGAPVQGLLAMALTGLLLSPISWTHHWVWVLLIPPVLITDRAAMHPALRGMLWALVGLTVLAPYWWFSSGAVADVLNDSLALLGFASLSCWAVCLLRLGRERPEQSPSKAGHTAVTSSR